MEKARRTKALVIVVLLIVIAGLTIAFAALSATLNIKGTAYLDASKWGIKFENLSEPVKVGTASASGTAKIEETKSAEITGINVSLSTPGDRVTYTVDLVNEGTINAKIDKIEKTELTEEQQKYLTFKVAYTNGLEVSEGDILSKGETRNLTITIEFIKDLTKEDLPTSTNTISLSYKLNFVQTDEKVTSTGQGTQQACTSFEKKDTYNVGDVIALCNTSTNKSEDFYVISDNGTTLTALAKYNLLVGNTVVFNDDFSDVASVTPIPTSEEGYGLQSSIAANYKWNIENYVLTSNTITGVIPFSENIYWEDSSNKLLSKYGTSYPANVFDSNSNLYEPLENYKNYLRSKLDKPSVDTGLLTYEQVLKFECEEGTPGSCKTNFKWFYSSNFWTAYASRAAEGAWGIYNFDSFGVLSTNVLVTSSGFGLRPVITIKKSEI